MPRPPKNLHPLRAIRAATDFASQTEFAKTIGVSMATIQAIENGKLRLTPKLASRIREVTGASDVELLRGSAGKARTIAGRPYTTEYFQDWQRRQRQRMEQESLEREDLAQLGFWMQLLLDAARLPENFDKLQQVRTLFAESMDSIRDKSGLANAVNDFLIPFRTVETAAATVAAWKKDPTPDGVDLGFSAALPLAAKTRLTISLQSSPCWAPHLAAPRSAQENLELIPTCYFIVGMGKAGGAIADAWWRGLCREHGIDGKNGTPLHGAPTGNWQAFFRKVRQEGAPEKYVPRALFLDLEASDLAEISVRGADFYHPGAMLPGTQNSGNIFAGPQHPNVASLLTKTLHFLRHYSEDCSGLGGVFLVHSLEGGTGSGLASQLLTRLPEEFPLAPAVSIAPLPAPSGSHAVAAAYNVALATCAIFKKASAAFFLENEALAKCAQSDWRMAGGSLPETNALVAEALCAISAPLRYASRTAPPWQLSDLVRSLNHSESTGPAQFTFRTIPLPAAVRRGRQFVSTSELLAAGINSLSKSEKKSGEPIGVFIQARAAEAHLEIRKSIPKAKAQSRQFRLSLQRRPGAHESITLARPGDFSSVWRSTHQKATALFQRQAYLHFYEQLGVHRSEIAAALETLRLASASSQNPEAPV